MQKASSQEMPTQKVPTKLFTPPPRGDISGDLLVLSELNGHNLDHRVPRDPAHKKIYLDQARSYLIKKWQLDFGELATLVALHHECPSKAANFLKARIPQQMAS